MGIQRVTTASGAGWSCSTKRLVCTRPSVLAPGERTPAVTLMVANVAGSDGERSMVRVNGRSLAYPVY